MIEFTKMHGSGNDFILIDNRAGVVHDAFKVDFVKRVCPRATAVGADGVIFVEDDPDWDFCWDFFNADGSAAEMCGNGARCAAVFAKRIGAAEESMTFRTLAGLIRATLVPGGARVQLTDATAPQTIPDLPLAGGPREVYFVNTGVPHVVVPVDDLEAVDLRVAGAKIRYHDRFQPAGANANFVVRDGERRVAMRTYERGVEDETLACGTGAVAVAIAAHEAYGMPPPITVRTRSGVELIVDYCDREGAREEVFLEGPVITVYDGRLANVE